MAKHITRWRPDTCGCVLELEWDDEHPEDAREHNAVKVERCHVHQHEGEPHQAVFDTVLGENRHKNDVHQHLIASMDDAHVTVNDRGQRLLKHHPKFEFDSDRNLQVTFPTAPAAVRIAARAALKTRKFARAVEIA